MHCSFFFVTTNPILTLAEIGEGVTYFLPNQGVIDPKALKTGGL